MDIVNIILENWEIISTALLAVLGLIFGAGFKTKLTKLIKEICDIYYRLNDLFKNITAALEDKKLTKAEINNIKAEIRLLKNDFYELIRIFRK